MKPDDSDGSIPIGDEQHTPPKRVRTEGGRVGAGSGRSAWMPACAGSETLLLRDARC
jgi:hypothetical protein